MPTILDKRVTDPEKISFVMSFTEESEDMRKEFEDIWLETLQNYLVNPFGEGSALDKDWPLSTDPWWTSQARGQAPMAGYSILADSESHQIVESWLASLVTMTLGPEPGFIQARRRGLEDTFMASTVTRLLEYDLAQEGVYRSMYQWYKDGFIFGTGVCEALWDYAEAPVKSRIVTNVNGVEIDQVVDQVEVVRDDPRISNIDILDFFPDPGKPRIPLMRGCVKRFDIDARAALAQSGEGAWDRAAVRKAIHRQQTDDFKKRANESLFEGHDRPRERRPHKDFINLIAYQYWGEVPWRSPKTTSDPSGDRWRRITVLAGELVEDIPWPLRERRLPFYEFTVNPIGTRFYGISPLETCRFDQDFANMLKMNIADATVKMTHPQPIVDSNAIDDPDKFMSFRPNSPIMSDGPTQGAASYLQYRPDIASALGVLSYAKDSMRNRSGMPDVNMGLGFTSNPRSASEASLQASRASARPEMIAGLAEREALPALGKGLLALNQQFLDDSQALSLRVGALPAPVNIQEILFDYDLEFVGSRRQHNKQSRLEALERAAQVIGQLPVAAMFPWGAFMARYLGALDLPELEVAVANPEMTIQHLMMTIAARGGGGAGPANNDVGERPSPSGMLPAQTTGGLVS